ncbi:MAG: DUF748 domain-containing protein [Bacteroidia bacterium]
MKNKTPKKRLKKAIFILIGIFIIVPALIIAFISPITKYLVEKYSVKYTGRRIKMNWAYVNPFTGYVHFNRLKIYEAQNDSIFFSADGISADFALRKMLSETYEISDLVLDNPKGIIILNTRSDFNFTDLITRFSPSAADSNKPPVHFNILNVKIKDGVFYFRDTLIHINYFIKSVEFESSGKQWNNDTVKGGFSFSAGVGTGDMKGNFNINLKSLDYRYAIVAHQFNLAILQQYLQSMINYGTFSANLDADLKTSGNFSDEDNQDTKGRFAINDFHFGKKTGEDYASFDKFVMTIIEVNPAKHLYNLDSVILNHPYFKYEKYDNCDNIETIFGKQEANIAAADANHEEFNLVLELAHYLIDISKNFFHSQYRVNKVAVTAGDIQFNDYSINEKFSIAANPLYVSADSINRGKGRINVYLKAGIKPYGEANIYASINPRDSEDFDVDTYFGKVPVAMFNPYLISYTSFPLDRGTIQFNAKWKVRKGQIQSENHLLIIDPRVTRRLKNKADKWIPVWLAMAFIRDEGNIIDYSIPVTGDLRKPDFHLHNLVSGVLKNIFVKPFTTPKRMKVQEQQKVIEKSLSLKWGMRQSLMLPSQKRLMEKLAVFMAKNKTTILSIYPEHYETKEKEYILFFEAKKKYYLSINPSTTKTFSEKDSIEVDKMSIRDSSFSRYLNKHITHALIFTIQGKCLNFVGATLVNNKYRELNEARAAGFISCFKKEGVDNQVKVYPSTDIIPYNGFSFYKMTYSGELPDFLVKAYKDMDELNDEAPREEYEKDRKKIKAH